MLQAIVEVHERTGRAMTPSEIVQQSGLDEDAVQAALRALAVSRPLHSVRTFCESSVSI